MVVQILQVNIVRAMEEEALKLFGAWGSPYSRRVELAFKLKGVPYDYVEEDLANKSYLLIKYNPIHKKVPVLLHHGKPMVESLIILEYIEETWKMKYPLFPQDPYEKAMARFWIKFIDEECFKVLWMSCWSKQPVQETFMQRSHEYLSLLENELKGKKFFGGDKIGIVDIAANFLAFWVPVLQEVTGVTVIDADQHPVLCRWAKDFINHDVVKECLPPREKLIAFFGPRKEAIMATNSMVY